MPLTLQEKQLIIDQISVSFKSALSVVIAELRGVTVNEINKLRKSGRECGVYIRIVRNTLVRRAIINTPFEILTESFIGPILIAFSTQHPGAGARLFKTFAIDHVGFDIKSAFFEGKIISGSQINLLATIPTYEEAIIKFMLVIKEVSIGKLARTFAMLSNQKKQMA